MAINSKIVQFTVIAQFGGVPAVTVVNIVQIPGDPEMTVAGAEAIGAGRYSSFLSDIMPHLSESYKTKSWRVAILGPTFYDNPPTLETAVEVVYSGPLHAVADGGGVADDYLPSFDSYYVLLKTANGLRRYRGSQHFAGVAEIATDGQFVSPTQLGLFQPDLTAWYVGGFTTVVGATTFHWNPGVFSRTYCLLAPVGAKPYDYTEPILSATLSARVGSLLRRKTTASP